MHDPANIVLDEPTNGLDVLATRALREALRWLRRTGTLPFLTVSFSSSLFGEPAVIWT